MAHELDITNGVASFANSRADAWHRLGQSVGHTMTAREALAASHLANWNVRKMPLIIPQEPGITDDGVRTPPPIPVPDMFATVRGGPVCYDFGEDNQFRTVRSRALRLAEVDTPPQFLRSGQIASAMAALPRVRDKLLVSILAESGMRIGEALGLRREDMHLLASNNVLGCSVRDPHIHVLRRANANGSLAKSRPSSGHRRRRRPLRRLSVREVEIPEGDSSDFVFVNRYKPPLGKPLRYHNAKKLFERLSETMGFNLRPHMFLPINPGHREMSFRLYWAMSRPPQCRSTSIRRTSRCGRQSNMHA